MVNEPNKRGLWCWFKYLRISSCIKVVVWAKIIPAKWSVIWLFIINVCWRVSNSRSLIWLTLLEAVVYDCRKCKHEAFHVPVASYFDSFYFLFKNVLSLSRHRWKEAITANCTTKTVAKFSSFLFLVGYDYFLIEWLDRFWTCGALFENERLILLHSFKSNRDGKIQSAKAPLNKINFFLHIPFIFAFKLS